MKIWIDKWSKKLAKYIFFENKVGLTESKVIEETNTLGLNEKSSGRKCDRNMDSLNISLNNHKYNKNKKQLN